MNHLMEMVNGTFSYNQKDNIFEDINFKVQKGDVFCILGANGTGKTTLIKCLNGLMKLNGINVKIVDMDHRTACVPLNKMMKL